MLNRTGGTRSGNGSEAGVINDGRGQLDLEETSHIMEWKQPPLHRHLSTIGIGPVFICPPPHTLPQEPAETADENNAVNGADTSHENHEIIDTWEIIGDIKSSPDDFLVREIGWAPPLSGDACNDDNLSAASGSTSRYRRLPGWSRRVAGLCPSEQPSNNDTETTYPDYHEAGNDECTPIQDSVRAAKRLRSDVAEDKPLVLNAQQNQSEKVKSEKIVSETANDNPQSKAQDTSIQEEPLDGLKRILMICHCNDNINESERDQSSLEAAADDTLHQLTELENSTIKRLDSSNSAAVSGSSNLTAPDNEDNIVWIPTAKISHYAPSDDENNWKLVHQYIRLAHPLLKTEASAVGPSNNTPYQEPLDKSWVKVSLDRMYFSIAPLLAKPSEDLPKLYKFRNNDPVAAASGSRCRNVSRTDKNRNGNAYHENKQQLSENHYHRGQVLLRLRPDLPRSERRVIHQALTSSRRRDFDTSTLNDVPLGEDGEEKTAAIVVQWSRSAIQGSQKKRKRNGDDQSKQTISAIFCVLRKEQCEHQVAINKIARALKCRAGDIGLAGIKDMQAVTYQFCTLRNVDLKRVQRANESLGGRVKLSDCVAVQGSDALLDRGKLLGNRFEITLRNLERVQRKQSVDNASWTEQYIPVKSSHIDAMVKRIRDNGFINYYGEQRVGDAGSESHVGVRSFDVGKAMLKEDFSTAIDLIMTGRSSNVYTPTAEEVEAREVWRRTKDARQTLAKFPKNTSAMTRERDLMKGMLRYDNALEAIRCVHHNVRMFWIHAYQSFVWNRVATERMKMFGLTPVIGDLYETHDSDSADAQVHVVTDPSSVDISQIVLPLPGYNIQYPTNSIGELYHKILSEDGITMSKDMVPEATAKGSYRKLIQKAHGLKWEKVEGKIEHVNKEDDLTVSNAKFTFELESGCYATMMLRELMVMTMARDSKINNE